MKPNYPNGIRSLSVFAVLLFIIFVAFNSFQRKMNAAEAVKNETRMPGDTDRLFSVANIYYTEDGKKVEAWFYETPLVYEFSAGDPNAKNNFELLKSAKEKNEIVNIRQDGRVGNRIKGISAATSDQIAKFRAEVLKREKAVEVSTPASEKSLTGTNSFTKGSANNLIGVVPNTTVLNNIFGTVRGECCKLYGPYLFGQCVPFQFVADGCYARAHKMRQVIESWYGYTSYKVFNYACNGAGTLSVNATLWGNNCCVHWWYHVASYVIVQVGANQYAYLIDPAMFTGPVSIPTWVAAQKNVACGYGGAAQGQVYYTSNAYAPSTLNQATCTLVPYADNTYTAANATCAAYSAKQGCSF
jgi:Glutaminase